MLSLILCIAGFVVGGIAFFFVGTTYRKKVAEKEIGSAEEEARRIINEAIKGGESKKREMLLRSLIHIWRADFISASCSAPACCRSRSCTSRR